MTEPTERVDTVGEPTERDNSVSALNRHATEEVKASRHSRQVGRKPRRRKFAAAFAILVIAGGGAAIAVFKPFHSPPPTPSASTNPTALASVTRQSLSSQTTVNGTLGYANSYTVVVPSGNQPSGDSQQGGGQQGGSASGSSQSGGSSSAGSQGQSAGTFTALPAVSQVIRQGQSLYSVSGSQVALLYGSVPVYRSLSEGMTGTDVKQLNGDLVALGDAARSELDPNSDYFGSATATALDKLQSNLGLTRTGTLPLGQVVFEPTAILVSSVSATLGAPAQPGGVVLQATSTTRQVTAQVDATQQPDVAPGAQVSIVLPNNQTTPGVVTSVGTEASAPSGGGSGSTGGSGGTQGSGGSGGSGSSQDTINVDVRMNDPSAAGSLDQAPVQVNITTATVHDALVVPIDALLAEPTGYAVEVAGAHGARATVPVTLGLFDDAAGLVQVTATGLSAGQQVVVPQL
jgi:uncharacterized membrane protein YgcG